MKEYLYTTYVMIQSLMPGFKTIHPIETIYKYNNLQSMYVIEGKYIDSLRIRNYIDTVLITEQSNQPDNILFHKTFLTDLEIKK